MRICSILIRFFFQFCCAKTHGFEKNWICIMKMFQLVKAMEEYRNHVANLAQIIGKFIDFRVAHFPLDWIAYLLLMSNEIIQINNATMDSGVCCACVSMCLCLCLCLCLSVIVFVTWCYGVRNRMRCYLLHHQSNRLLYQATINSINSILGRCVRRKLSWIQHLDSIYLGYMIRYRSDESAAATILRKIERK